MKKINFLGDSITAGSGVDNPQDMYTRLVSKYFNAEECNFGLGGTRIARQLYPSDHPEYNENFMQRAVKMPKDADFTFCFGGTNDYGHGDAPLGKLGDSGDDTFYGATARLFKYLADTYGKKNVCIILPLPRYNQSNPYGEGNKKAAGAILTDYIGAEKEVAELLDMKYLDFSENFPEPKSNLGDELTADGLHPNKKGHKLLADLLIKNLESKGFTK